MTVGGRESLLETEDGRERPAHAKDSPARHDLQCLADRPLVGVGVGWGRGPSKDKRGPDTNLVSGSIESGLY